MSETKKEVNEQELREDGRCKHGMLSGQCSYCQGIPMPKYGQSVGLAWIGK
jgi:hypothetical protein